MGASDAGGPAMSRGRWLSWWVDVAAVAIGFVMLGIGAWVAALPGSALLSWADVGAGLLFIIVMGAFVGVRIWARRQGIMFEDGARRMARERERVALEARWRKREPGLAKCQECLQVVRLGETHDCPNPQPPITIVWRHR